jgi:hypothetical protein
MNSLESLVLRGACIAQKSYTAISGYWLWHGPESFLQTVVAQEVGREFTVYVDASKKKVLRDMASERGRPRLDLRERPDISVWSKTTGRLRAIVEIKRAYNRAPLKQDAVKVERHLCASRGANTGYMLVYSEAKAWARMDRLEFLERRFSNWSQNLSWRCVGMEFGTAGDEQWAWGFCLLRCP